MLALNSLFKITGVFSLSFKEDKDPINKSLLPSGLRDQLPPHAAHEASIVEGLINTCEVSGYEELNPHSLNMRTLYFQAW